MGDGGVWFEGRVVDVVFQGADVRYRVELADGTTVDVRGRDGVRADVDGTVGVRVREGCGVLLPVDGSPTPTAADGVVEQETMVAVA